MRHCYRRGERRSSGARDERHEFADHSLPERSAGNSKALDLGGGHAHIGFGAGAHFGRAAFAIEIKHDPLPLAQRTKDRADECICSENDFATVLIGHQDTFAGDRVVELYDALHWALARLDDFAGFDTRRAGIHPFWGAFYNRAHALDVWIPTPFVAPVRVGNSHTEVRLLPTNVAHCSHVEYLIKTNRNRGRLSVPSARPWIVGGGRADKLGSAPMPTLSRLGPQDVRAVIEAFRDALRSHQEELNRLNVYPVPDGDTGTNMALTLESVVAELRTAESMAEVCKAIARGSLMGARGNSGVITSQILRGLVEVFAVHDSVGGAELVAAMRCAADAAYEAVMRPVEGTILTVVRETAEGLERAAAAGHDSLEVLLEHAEAAAHASVLSTPALLPALAAAGVVDSGGSGFTLLIAALRHVHDGRPLPEPAAVSATPRSVERHLAGDDIANLRYEVMFLLDATVATIPAFRETWMTVGDSIVVVGGDGLYNCHIHTNDIGAAIEAGIQAGKPHKIRVTDLFEEVEAEEQLWVREAVGDIVESEPVETAVVAVAVGEGLRRLLSSLGVQSVIAGGQSMNPSTAQILEAVEAANAQSVIVLPNNKNIIPVAKQVDSLTTKSVAVVPTASVMEALAALVMYDPEEELAPNVEAFNEAVEHVRSGEVTQAVRDSHAECGAIAAGDWLAIARDGGIIAAKPTTAEACTSLLDFLVDENSEIVTVVIGADGRASDAERIREHLKLAHPQVDFEFHEGGQPLYPYLVGVE